MIQNDWIEFEKYFFLKCTCLVDNLRCYKYRGNSTKISIKKKIYWFINMVKLKINVLSKSKH